MNSAKHRQQRGYLGSWAVRVALAAGISICLGCVASGPTDQQEAVLLVSLQDGTVIQQTISLDADICFKTNGRSATTCLTRGEPIFDQGAGAIIGYEMNSSQIELVAR